MMTSSMLTGDKRWAPARRGGMTVLGKVAVPKPINLPSQRLENHGLDPKVEIVPKGTHSWVRRSSASSPNAWGSPITEGGNGLPSHLSGLPSSGRTGTRPTTGGSDRGHDPISNAWGLNSRLSSSSGALSSNQTSQTASRPWSAETRRGSSHLSRFSESLSDTSGAWGRSGTTEKMGMSSSKNDGFSLTSGDFPLFGSEKGNSGKNVDSQGSSAGVASGRGGNRDSEGDVSINVNAKIGAAGSWRKENSLYGDNGARSNVEKWHADPNIPPKHHDCLHGPLVNNHPRGFRMEPNTYYRPQIPPPALANPQPVPPPEAGRRGSQTKNGDIDAYIRPGMPLRPAFNSTVPYDGYYGPLGGYCKSNERDAPFKGMPMGPTAYNRDPGPHPGNSHGRTSGFGPSGKPVTSEQMEAQDSRGPYKVLSKQHDSWEGKDEELNWEDCIKTNVPKRENQRNLSRENGWRAENKKDIEIDRRRTVADEGASPEAADSKAVPMKVKSPEPVSNVSVVYGDSLGKKFEHADSIYMEVMAAPKDSSLIKKIEGFNAKAHDSDGRQYPGCVSSTEEPENKIQVGYAMGSRSTNEAGIDSISARDSRVINTVPHEGRFSVGDKSLDSTAVVSGTAISRRPTHGRADLRSEARFNTLEGHGWRNKPQVVDPKNVAATGHGETSISISHGQRHISGEIIQNSMSRPSGKDDYCKGWAPARRGGMTVLGKVAVPKPINLPSQRLENLCLDPKVEIVPKVTHSWGSRSPASSPNAWGSSNTEGDNSSPTHLSGRPSSGGTGNRPATAGSDRVHDPISNAWGSNSRPSSSSGALSSNQTSNTTSRPRSAETRPGCSQLSCFAESLSDTAGAWGGNETTEKMRMSSSKNDGFSPTSGDFPTFDSEKDNSGKNVDSQDYSCPGRPGSSAGLASGRGGNRDSEGDVSIYVNAKIGAAGSWRKENSLYGEDGARSTVEKWHGDPRTYPNRNITPQHHDGWHGPLVNNHPAGFPMEPFPYYRPQMPPPALANPQPVPPPAAGPRGSHPKNGDIDAYIRPGMPLRPGFYPTVPYDGYYGPLVGYCNPNERDAPFMGMAMGPTAYNRFPGPDSGNSNGKTSGFGSIGEPIASEQLEPQDSRGPYKVLPKEYDSWEGNDEELNWEDCIKSTAPYPLKGEHPRNLSRENGCRADNKNDTEIDTRRRVAGEGASPEAVDNQAVPMEVKPPEHVSNVSVVYGDSSGKKFEHADSISTEVLAAPKDFSLIQKIEGFNAKAHSSDGLQYPGRVSSTEEPKNKILVGNAMGSRSTIEAGIDYISSRDNRVINNVLHEGHLSAVDKSLDSTAVVSGTAISRRPTHSKADLRGEARFNTLEGDGWRKKPQAVDPKNVASTVHSETSSVSHGQRHISLEISQNSMSRPSGKDDYSKGWAPARRGGMTVLGKVAVPKPINLPSQRLEKHGLDPTVEIVPKGTHNWVRRTSASSPNSWGSPNTDGGNGSPSHLSGLPASGATGTRPTTAGSDSGHDPISNAWGSNSRPSSSSGALSSNQTSHTTSRPRSAETRPGSSQLSRFAESLSDTSGACGGSGTTEKMGMSSSKNDGFSLTSGDFPLFGSEKDNSGKNVDSQDYGSPGRPGSSAGVASRRGGNRVSEGDVSINVNAKIGAAGSWRKENSLYREDGARSTVEKWHADPLTFPNTNIPHQHHDGWHGPLVNNHPLGFPMEPFTYYHPQMPPPALSNPQPVPSPGAGPRGSHPKNGDIDAYIRPGMPLRPGFYPTVPYDGYFGPLVGYCNSNERDAPFMGMGMGHIAYNRYPGPDPGNFHGRTSGFGPIGKPIASEQVEAQDSQGLNKVLPKLHDSWEGKDEELNWEDCIKTNAPYTVKGEHPRNLSRDNGWRADNKNDIEIDTKRMMAGEGASPEDVDNQAVPMKVKSPEHVSNLSGVYVDSSGKKFEHADTISMEVLAAPKDSSLIQKIEGLNAQVHALDGRQYPERVSSTEEPKNKILVGYAMGNRSTNEAGIDSISSCDSRVINNVPHEGHFSAGDKGLDSTAVVSGTAISRRPTHGRADFRGEARFNSLEGDGWRKKPQVVDPKNVASTVYSETSSVPHGQRNISAEISQNSMSGKDDIESVQPVSDPSDSQRVKLRELAKRLKEREKEEEERTREQRAKALAKLEELNRRTQTGEGTTQKKLEDVSTSTIQNRKDEPLNLLQPIPASKSGTPSPSLGSEQIKTSHEESTTADPPTVVAGKSRTPTSALKSSPRMVAPSTETIVDKVEKSTSTSSDPPVEAPKTARKDSVVVHEQLISLQQDGNNSDAGPGSSTLRVPDSSASMQKSTGYSQKPVRFSLLFGSFTEVEEALFASSSSILLKGTTILDAPVEPRSSETILDLSSARSQADSKDANQSSDSCSSLTNEETLVRTTNSQWKSNHPRRTIKNPQGNKPAEKNHGGDALVWAPVRSQNKTEVCDDANQSTVVEAVVIPSKSDQQVQSHPRNKRAEMERYFPKPVAKELSQLAIVPTTSDEVVERPSCKGAESSQTSGTVIRKTVPFAESRTGDGRQNRPEKVHGSWRQWTVAESTANHRSCRNVAEKFDLSSMTVQPSFEWDASDGWNMPEIPDTAVNIVPCLKDESATARGKRHPHRGHKTPVFYNPNNPEDMRSGGQDNEKVYVESTASEIDPLLASKENHAAGEQSTSHWQPKYQATNQRGSRPSNSVNVGGGSEGGRTNKKESPSSQGRGLLPQPEKDVFGPHSHREKNNLEGARAVGHQEPGREKRMGGPRGRPIEYTSHSNVDVQPEHSMSPGFPKSGNLNSRFGREHDARGEWSGSVKDTKQQHTLPATRDRQRQRKGVWPQNNSKLNNFESPKEGFHNSSGRYRVKGQARRGGSNFYGRGVQVDAGYE
ncbi:uncharacterized protein LOC126671227 isoform X2 [Mercurialis annua]|uniref:uncharacterized protein LOC126671227 isoform X2 n=1 Tax=Mercurialis annua TaxID=3986 RepID=UPI00215F4C17|nr:uncharacterized protein LOC126671227 isoform X2 [Mercurialis annua]